MSTNSDIMPQVEVSPVVECFINAEHVHDIIYNYNLTEFKKIIISLLS